MTPVGHNNPPSIIEHSVNTLNALGIWLSEHPVIANEDEAREGKLLVDRAKDAVHEMETERTGLVSPLNEQVKEINDRYRSPRTNLENTLQVLILRIDAFAEREEERRQKEAEAKRQAALEAERIAREAERAEEEAKELAAAGQLDINIADVTSHADAAYGLYKVAHREAQLAERETKVKIGGGFRRALSRRNQETLEVESWETAISFLGLTDRIRDAILTDARAYRKEFDELPPGITAKYDRSL